MTFYRSVVCVFEDMASGISEQVVEVLCVMYGWCRGHTNFHSRH